MPFTTGVPVDAVPYILTIPLKILPVKVIPRLPNVSSLLSR